MTVLCACGGEIHVGSIVGTTAGVGGPLMPSGAVVGVVAAVRHVAARAPMTNVYPPVAGVDAYTLFTVLVTSDQSYPAPARGEYISASAGTDITARGCAGCP